MTLIEVMMGFLVIGTASLAALAGLLLSFRMADANLRALTAAASGRSVLEQLVAVDFDSLLGATLPVDLPSSPVGAMTAGAWNTRTNDFRQTPDRASDDLVLSINPTITRVTDSAGLDYARVVVTFRWDETSFFQRRTREDSLAVIVAPVSSY